MRPPCCTALHSNRQRTLLEGVQHVYANRQGVLVEGAPEEVALERDPQWARGGVRVGGVGLLLPWLRRNRGRVGKGGCERPKSEGVLIWNDTVLSLRISATCYLHLLTLIRTMRSSHLYFHESRCSRRASQSPFLLQLTGCFLRFFQSEVHDVSHGQPVNIF